MKLLGAHFEGYRCCAVKSFPSAHQTTVCEGISQPRAFRCGLNVILGICPSPNGAAILEVTVAI